MTDQHHATIAENTIHLGDCLDLSQLIDDGSVDLILTDPPYGTMNGFNEIDWDYSINPKDLHAAANRILRKNGKMVLFSQEPYTSRLIVDAIPNLPFLYRMIWEKDNFANALLCNKAPVSYFEDILVFSKNHTKHDYEGLHPLRDYFKQVLAFIGLNLKQVNEKLGHRRAEHTFYVDSTQYSLCTEDTYNELINVFNINIMCGFKQFKELKNVDLVYRKSLIEQMTRQAPATFNLPPNAKYKSNILKYKKDYTNYHPTQKPVLLLEDLIKTYSNKGDLIVDLTSGSGTTAIAAHNLGRRFICIEKDEDYHAASVQRLKDTQAQLRLF